MTTDAIYEERGSDWSQQVSVVATTRWLQRDQTLPLSAKVWLARLGHTMVMASLGTRPSKNRKGGSGKSAGVEVYTAPGMQAHFQLAFD